MFVEDLTSIPEQAHWNCVRKGKIHVLEIFAGSARFSQCCALSGLKVGTPVDIRTGFDVMTSKGRHRRSVRTPDLGRVKETFSPSPRCGFSHQKYTDQNYVDQLCKNMTDDDRALLVLYSSKQESLKASSTSALIGKKRKEATAMEIRAYQKQFHEAKLLECKSWLDNEVFDLSTHARFMSGTGSPVAGSLP